VFEFDHMALQQRRSTSRYPVQFSTYKKSQARRQNLNLVTGASFTKGITKCTNQVPNNVDLRHSIVDCECNVLKSKLPYKKMATKVVRAGARGLRRKIPDVMSVTPKAVERVSALLSKKPDAIGLRIGVRTRGMMHSLSFFSFKTSHIM
jgi:hypothetical protein